MKTSNGLTLTSAVITILSLAIVPVASAAGQSIDPINTVVQKEASKLDCVNGDSTKVIDESGLTHVIGCEPVRPEAPGKNGIQTNSHWSPYESRTWKCGSSYIRNQQIAYLTYRGTAHASGEVASGGDCGGYGRVYKVSIAYRRGGSTLASAEVWSGQTKTITANDSVRSQVEPTTFHYDFILGP